MTATFPASPVPASLEWHLQGNSQLFRSPLSGAEQVVELPGAIWVVSLRFDRHIRSDMDALDAFLNNLNGQAGIFYLWHHAHENPTGVATGTPVVSGASQTGKTLDTSGWSTAITNILKAGDMIAVGSELKQITANVNSDSGGLATLAVTPSWRASPADGATITVTKALGTFRLASPHSVRFAQDSAELSLRAMETF